LRAYGLVGFTPERDYRYVAINQALRKLHPAILEQVLDGLRDTGSMVRQDPETDRVVVNEEFSVSVVIARCVPTPSGLLRWKIRFDTSRMPDITIVVRMDTTNHAAFDYYLFPRLDCVADRLRLAEDNAMCLDSYRFETLDLLYQIAAPVCCSAGRLMSMRGPQPIELIPISRITVLNPRARNKRQHREIVNNIRDDRPQTSDHG